MHMKPAVSWLFLLRMQLKSSLYDNPSHKDCVN